MGAANHVGCEDRDHRSDLLPIRRPRCHGGLGPGEDRQASSYEHFRLLLTCIDKCSRVQGAIGTERLPEVRLAGYGREAQTRRSPAEEKRAAIDDLLTAEQAAAILQLSPKTIKDWLRAGKLTGCKIGRLWRVRPADLEAFIQASRRWHTGEAQADPRKDR